MKIKQIMKLKEMIKNSRTVYIIYKINEDYVYDYKSKPK